MIEVLKSPDNHYPISLVSWWQWQTDKRQHDRGRMGPAIREGLELQNILKQPQYTPHWRSLDHDWSKAKDLLVLTAYLSSHACCLHRLESVAGLTIDLVYHRTENALHHVALHLWDWLLSNCWYIVAITSSHLLVLCCVGCAVLCCFASRPIPSMTLVKVVLPLSSYPKSQSRNAAMRNAQCTCACWWGKPKK